MRVCGVLGHYVEDTAPNVELISVVLDILEVFSWADLVQLGEIKDHRVDDTHNQDDAKQIGILGVVVYINGIHIHQHDGEVEEMEEAPNLVEVECICLPLEGDELVELSGLEQIDLSRLRAKTQ